MVVTVAGVAYIGREPAATRAVDLRGRVATAVRPEVIGVVPVRDVVDPAVPVAITIPPPRWLVQRMRPPTERITARQGGLGWQTDPYAE